MKLTDKQLKIMEWSDKTLSFGCIILQCNRHSRITAVQDEEDYFFLQTEMDGNELYGSDDDGYLLWWYKNLWFETCESLDDIIWHPMTRGRLCYLYDESGENIVSLGILAEIRVKLKKEKDTHKTVLERSEEVQDLVIAFLETLPKE